jgi:hypothetical protein
MTPFEFFQWCIAGALGLVVLAFGLTIAIVMVKAAFIAKGKPHV